MDDDDGIKGWIKRFLRRTFTTTGMEMTCIIVIAFLLGVLVG